MQRLANRNPLSPRSLANKGLACTALFSLLLSAIPCLAQWKPAEGPLATRWTKEVSPDNAHGEYPRPQRVRPKWQNLNGPWDYAIRPREEACPETFSGKILVPFPVESALSGVMKPVDDTQRLWYRRAFEVPEDWRDGRVLLHFEAVDWETTVWVNGKKCGAHRGGYDPFTVDVTDALKPDGKQELVVAVWDPTDAGTQPRGKQVAKPKGIWYTAVTGIWRTVWLEPVPTTSIADLKMTPDIDTGTLHLRVATEGAAAGDTVVAEARDGDRVVAKAAAPVGKPISLKLDNPKLWSPSEPFLYDLRVSVQRGGKALDRVESYFGMREVALGKDEKGLVRILLNGRFVFQFGPLDQGWWPDGLYTAPTDEALRYDLEVLKRLGCNMLRKHVKVEPRRFYSWCDRLGLLVWQDMPSGDKYIGKKDPDIVRSPESARQFELELKRMIDSLENHPSIILWVPFNEGWGQYDTARIVDFVKGYDPTRLVINTSGWADRGVGDVMDMHRYPGPAMPEPEPNRAVVLGEFGGLGLPLEGHLWWNKRNWGYRTYQTKEALNRHYLDLMRKLEPLIGKGLSAAVYTQTSDVEGEVNGMMTYDREVLKLDADRVGRVHRQLILGP